MIKNQKVYDVPTRVFHALFALLFIISFSIAKWTDDESILYAYHMIGGMIMLTLVILRVGWGMMANNYNEVKDIWIRPNQIIKYFKDYLKKIKWSYPGHNPASAAAAFLMMLLTLGLVFTGIGMTGFDQKKNLQDVHELIANTFLLVVLVHILGVLMHSIRFQDFIPLSMITGNKELNDQQMKIFKNDTKNHTWFGILMVFIVGMLFVKLNQSLDKKTGQLNFLNKTFQLVEIETNDESVKEEPSELDTN